MVKLIFALLFLSQSAFAESDFSIALRGGQSIGLYSAFSKWEYNDRVDGGIGIYYLSRPIEIWIERGIDDNHNTYTALSLAGEYWKDDTKEDVYWRGPTRTLSLGFTSRLEATKNVDYFWGISRKHYNTNFGYSDATSVSGSAHISIGKGFYVSPWFSIWKFDRFNAERGLGIWWSYRFIYK